MILPHYIKFVIDCKQFEVLTGNVGKNKNPFVKEVLIEIIYLCEFAVVCRRSIETALLRLYAAY